MTAQAPDGYRLVLVSDNLLETFGTRNSDGDPLSFEWGEPDENGWYTPVVTVTPYEPPEDEVLFMTSAGRLFNAVMRVYYNDAEDARHITGRILRHLRIPTAEDVANYRRDITS